MALGFRLGVWCAGTVASLIPAVCLAAAPRDLVVPSAAASDAYSRAADDSLTVSWIAREGAIVGYTVRVACAPDRSACADQEWFVERQAGADLSSYIVRVPVPAGATIVRVGLDAIDDHGRHLPVAERYVPRAAARVGATRTAGDTASATVGACMAPVSFDAPRPFLLASLEERDRPSQAGGHWAGAPVPILLSSRGPPTAFAS